MKTLSLVNLYKAEIKKNMMSQIKGGVDFKCTCSVNNPYNNVRKSGGQIGDLCYCSQGSTAMASVQKTPDLI
jgi:hypothetical protein